MKKINCYTVKIVKECKNEFKREVKEIAIENDIWIIINDRNFTKITKDKTWEFGYCMLDKPQIISRDNDVVLENGIFYTLYSHQTRFICEIRDDVEIFINDKYGFLSSIDLSFIK